MHRFQSFFDNILLRDLTLKCNTGPYHLCKLQKIVITFKRKNNLGINKSDENYEYPFILVFFALWNLTLQKPTLIKANKSIAAFKIFKGDFLGVQVTLRNFNMFNFLDRFINQITPAIAGIDPNFKGFRYSTSDLTVGLNDLSVFPEFDEICNSVSWGGKITFVFSNSDFNQNSLYLTGFQFPIYYENQNSLSKRS